MKTTLVIMAAGIGSRVGGGIKQLQRIGRNGEIIMDYSIHDAIAAGFNKIVFVIRRDIEADFKDIIGHRIENVCQQLKVEVEYAYQSLNDVPEGAVVPEERTKPWGTGQAVLAAKPYIEEPFAVINADDYYGKQAFCQIHDHLIHEIQPNALCMAGYHLKNTLSDYGSVTRGVCNVDEEHYLLRIDETHNIEKTDKGIVADGKTLSESTCVSMNMFGLTTAFLQMLEDGFTDFFRDTPEHISKKEFLIPIFIGSLLKEKKVSVKVLETKDRWFGITYQEDVEGVKNAFEELYKQGIYQDELYSDLISDIR